MAGKVTKVQEFVAHGAAVNCLQIGRKSGTVMATGGDTIGAPTRWEAVGVTTGRESDRAHWPRQKCVATADPIGRRMRRRTCASHSDKHGRRCAVECNHQPMANGQSVCLRRTPYAAKALFMCRLNQSAGSAGRVQCGCKAHAQAPRRPVRVRSVRDQTHNSFVRFSGRNIAEQ